MMLVLFISNMDNEAYAKPRLFASQGHCSEKLTTRAASSSRQRLLRAIERK
jgi:hypothetical protein